MHSSPQTRHSVSLAIYKKVVAVTYDQSFHTDLSTPVELLLPWLQHDLYEEVPLHWLNSSPLKRTLAFLGS